MSLWPDFKTPNPLGGSRSWKATFDSYDQHNDRGYYRVTLFDDWREVASFMWMIPMYWAGDDWTGPGFAGELRDQLEQAAISGQTNTTYLGNDV
jgi:hypothetical protein